MKKTIFFYVILLLVHFNAHTQNDNTVNIIGFGDGKTKDEATNAALRHCIEKTFGVFVTTNSKVVNDQLVNDEIASIASGNIVSYEVISESQKGDLFSVSVLAIISPDNIVKTYKNKGYSFEINGGVYAQNIQKEKFYKEQEPKIVQDFLLKYIEYPIFDTFEIKIGEAFRDRKKLSFIKKFDAETKQSYIRATDSYRFRDYIDEKSIKKIYDILPNNLFLSMDPNPHRQWNYMYMWESLKGTKVEVEKIEGGEYIFGNPTIETYIIPISYSPHYNEENAASLSEILTNFFNKICIKNNDYESKFGDTYTASLCLIKGYKNKKGKFKGSNIDKQTYKLRNQKSIKIINEFSQLLGIKSNPNSLEIINSNSKFELNSGWYYQPFQNYTSPLGRNNIFNTENYQLNLAEGVGGSYYINSGINTYNYRPCLILLNVTQAELSKLNKLEFKWK
jgi:hypothetical protein